MGKEILGIDANVLKEIKNIFKETSIDEIELEDKGKFYLKISRKKPVTTVAMPVQTIHQAAPVVQAAAPVEAAVPAGGQFDDEKKYHKIKSPVIGTFYASPSPDAPSFVKIGDMVSPDTTVCIVEAMKVMNEIKAEIKGKIVQAGKSNGDSVLSGEAMFIVEKH